VVFAPENTMLAGEREEKDELMIGGGTFDLPQGRLVGY